MLSRMKQKLLLWGQKRIEKGAWVFAPISFIWGFVAFWKNFLYDHKWRSPNKVSCVVVSVGNLVAGGTGKTPFVHLLASRFSRVPIAILSRGYGKIPDEAILLQKRVKNAKMYIGKDRVALARRAAQEGAKLILLDDGFQYRKLHRDFDLVLLASSDPFGKNHYLPWGFLRDHPKRLGVADGIFVTGKQTDLVKNPHVRLEVKVERILDDCQNEIFSLKSQRVAIFCGIAKPHLFQETVESLGAKVVSTWHLADHEKAEECHLREFAEKAKQQGAEALVCTEKDFVKWDLLPKTCLPMVFLEISLVVVEGFSIWENLIAKINEKIDN